MNKNLKWIAIFLSALTAGAAVANITQTYLYPTDGNITVVGVSVKWLNGTAISQINWGTVDNSTAYVMAPINVTNIENTPVTLSLSTNATSPSIISLTLTWNYTGTVLQPSNWVIVELTQTITATGPFTYNTIITAKEAQ